MADVVNTKWIYPPNFDGTFPSDTNCGHKRYIVNFTCQSDGTGEEDVTKIRRSDLLDVNGNVPKSLVVERIDYDVAGMGVTIDWSANTDDTIAILSDSAGSMNFRDVGGIYINDTNPGDDPEWGSIIFNTTASLGDSYTITLHVRTKD